MALFDYAVDYSKDVFRNIRGIKKSQDLFDDLSEDPANWEAANMLNIHTHPPLLTNVSALIQRPFDYSKNDFINYPFENITASRYSDGSLACWYGSETLETTIYETRYHFINEVHDSPDVFRKQKTITIDRRIALVNCHSLALDIFHKAKEFPWLIDSVNYTRCQEVGRRIASEGHPLLLAPSARQEGGVNLVVFNPKILSNVREHCKLQYIYDVHTEQIKIYRGKEEIIMSRLQRLIGSNFVEF